MLIKLADIDEYFHKNTHYLKALVLRCMNNFYFVFLGTGNATPPPLPEQRR